MKRGLASVVAGAALLLGVSTQSNAQTFDNNRWTGQSALSQSGKQVTTPAYNDPAGDDGVLGTVDDDYRPRNELAWEDDELHTSLYGSQANFIGAFHPDNDVLPIELLNSYARVNDETAEIGFTTASERNISHYTITETTTNGDKERVDRIPATNTTQQQEYTIEDRIDDNKVTTDSTGDGQVTYEIEAVNLDGSTDNEFTVAAGIPLDNFDISSTYPNPARRELNYEYEARTNTEATLSVYDVLGRRVHTETLDYDAGRHQEQLSVDDLASGKYFLRVTADDNTETQPFTVIR